MAIIPADEKVLLSGKGTNTTYSGSKALKQMGVWYTMQDVTDTVKPYKVYTALLTQSGGSEIDNLTTGSQLDFGQSYLIVSNPDNYDLSIYGAISSQEGEWFVCNDPSNPEIGYSSSLELYVNYGTPLVTVLENTIGNIWFTYIDVGNYEINSKSLFSDSKTFFLLTNPNVASGIVATASFNNTNSIGTVFYDNASPYDALNDVLQNAPIEIRVYN